MLSINQFSPKSKVWIYQSSRIFNEEEIKQLNAKLKTFAKHWTAHNNQLKAFAEVLEDRFILLMVDETLTEASGCSIDTSIHFIQHIEKEFHTNCFDRKIVNFKSDNNIKMINLDELSSFVSDGLINESTIVFNPLVHTKKEFEEKFQAPLCNTWLMNFV